jgi:hypothetical protein
MGNDEMLQFVTGLLLADLQPARQGRTETLAFTVVADKLTVKCQVHRMGNWRE